LTWTIKYTEAAVKQIKKLDNFISKKIHSYLIKVSKNPKKFGKPLGGNLSGFWRFRVMDYRIICKIEDKNLMVIVLIIKHRREVYN
jgi:mRNA interferase RelE/StbE